ncbi:FtsB family cell division protein [Calditerrivibrio nitroreducens]|uniref:Septum formation initiator n=1 Tax=Calditerrivibrio nitroreducens (strain DSM 19672 / NBRC 101217 / Yu37-1) TaxID=768670 RepID=E4TFK0_CALNY|nr:septum formation initiator family protein [Calditerrivibrio nitroreducens]ADR19573.1 Septum formation initiator [Calditerrivibrio nitroreducens DSM 19672]
MRHIIFLILIVGLVFYLVFSTNGFIQYQELIKIKEKYRRESMEYDKRISRLQEEIELLKKDRDYLEMVIKKELSYKKMDEDLYIILNGDENSNGIRDNKTD